MYKVLLQLLFQNTVPMAGTNKNCFEVNTSEKLQKKDFRKKHTELVQQKQKSVSALLTMFQVYTMSKNLSF